MTAEFDNSDPGLIYTYRPSLLGAAWQFTLAPEDIQWSAGGRSGCISYGKVRRIRMSYRPANMQSHRFLMEVWGEGAPKLRIVSTSWKSMFEQERLDKPYTVFVAALHRRLVEAGAPVIYQRGSNPLSYWPGLIMFAGVALGLGFLITRAVQQSAMSGAVFVGAFLLLFLWQGANFFRRNRPGTYRAGALPPALVPKG